MTEHRVRQLRFYFWAFACCLFALWNPWFSAGLAWLPLALFMPEFAAAPPMCSRCTSATDTHNTVQIDIIGAVDKTAGAICGDCSYVNVSTAVLTWTALGFPACTWKLSVTTDSPGSCWENFELEFHRNNPGQNTLWLTSFTSPFPDSQQWELTGSGGTQDCDDTETENSAGVQVPGGGHGCDLSGASVTMTPL